jgi:hypothetical protein
MLHTQPMTTHHTSLLAACVILCAPVLPACGPDLDGFSGSGARDWGDRCDTGFMSWGSEPRGAGLVNGTGLIEGLATRVPFNLAPAEAEVVFESSDPDVLSVKGTEVLCSDETVTYAVQLYAAAPGHALLTARAGGVEVADPLALEVRAARSIAALDWDGEPVGIGRPLVHDGQSGQSFLVFAHEVLDHEGELLYSHDLVQVTIDDPEIVAVPEETGDGSVPSGGLFSGLDAIALEPLAVGETTLVARVPGAVAFIPVVVSSLAP